MRTTTIKKHTFERRSPGLISQLERIKFTVINSLPWDPVVNVDVWSFICDVAHGALFVCCCCCCSPWGNTALCVWRPGQRAKWTETLLRSLQLAWPARASASRERIWPAAALLFRRRPEDTHYTFQCSITFYGRIKYQISNQTANIIWAVFIFE